MPCGGRDDGNRASSEVGKRGESASQTKGNSRTGSGQPGIRKRRVARGRPLVAQWEAREAFTSLSAR